MSVFNKLSKKVKEVKGENVLITGGVTLAGGYITTGVAVGIQSAKVCAIGIGLIYGGIGIVGLGAVKCVVEEIQYKKK